MTTAAIAAASLPATVTILAIGATGDTIGQGSGFVIRQDGVIVTNAHVMRGASRAIVILSSKETLDRVSVLDADSSRDIALLKIPEVGLRVLPTRTTIPSTGGRVVVIGSPEGLSQTVTEGIVSGTRMIDGKELVQMSAPISPGSSGGAVLDDQGRAFAVATSFLREGQQLNFAVPVRYALGLLSEEPSLRSVAAVFGPTSNSDPSSSTPANAVTAASRTTTPRRDVSGVYLIMQDVSTPASHWKQRGLLMATEHVGLLALGNVLSSDSVGSLTVYPVQTWRTVSTGEVLLRTGGLAYDGYQTDDGGFSARTSTEVKGVDLTFSVHAVPTSMPLSERDGLFDVKIRTTYQARGYVSPSAVDWDGQMAVAVNKDSVYIYLWVTNSVGGTRSMLAAGALATDGSFDISANSNRLHGFIREGEVYGDWEDVRDGGATFSGRLHAQRR